MGRKKKRNLSMKGSRATPSPPPSSSATSEASGPKPQLPHSISRETLLTCGSNRSPKMLQGESSISTDLTTIYKYIRLLEWKLIRIKYLNQRRSKGESLLDEEERLIFLPGNDESLISDLIHKLWNHVGHVSPNPLLINNTIMSFADLADWSSLNVNVNVNESEPTNKEEYSTHNHNDRFLCISVGFAVCCLDLKQRRDDDEVPIISTLNLFKSGFPGSMGVFKLESGAYMIGGQRFPGFTNDHPNDHRYLWGSKLFNFLYARYGAKPTSRDTYQLSLANNNTLSLSECNIIPPLNKPAIWPIVEKIGNQIHVIESLPLHYHSYELDTFPSHQVLDLEDIRRGWIEVEIPGTFIWNHILVGDQIYASSSDSKHYGVFDSKSRTWESQEYLRVIDHPFDIAHVAEILNFGYGKCTTEFHPDELDYPLYVVIALVEAEAMGLVPIAYIAMPTGEVLCFQRLPPLFKGLREPGYQGRVIKVEDKEDTVCATFHGRVDGQEVLYISTFNVKVCPDPSLQSSTDEGCFVAVDVKNSSIYKLESDPMENDYGWNSLGVNGCFL